VVDPELGINIVDSRREPHLIMTHGRSLWPREHGAYAQLGAPLLCALLVRAPTLPAILLASGAVFAFLANEPLLVLLGHRGRRMLATESGRARVRLTCVGSLGDVEHLGRAGRGHALRRSAMAYSVV
jgi:hypothetical protein